jgi:hypothetical protein
MVETVMQNWDLWQGGITPAMTLVNFELLHSLMDQGWLTLHHWPNLTANTITANTATTDTIVLAQQFNQDIVADMRSAFKNFVESGQIWAMLIGIIIGYLFRNLTTYG